jgi:hypothetical protein
MSYPARIIILAGIYTSQLKLGVKKYISAPALKRFANIAEIRFL